MKKPDFEDEHLLSLQPCLCRRRTSSSRRTGKQIKGEKIKSAVGVECGVKIDVPTDADASARTHTHTR